MFKYKIINLENSLNQKVTLSALKNFSFKISGPLGKNELYFDKKCLIVFSTSELYIVSALKNSLFGTYRSLIKNTYRGLICGYKQFLEIRGVGYKISKTKEYVQLDLGFSSPVIFENTTGLKFNIKKNKFLKVFGLNLNLVNQTVSRLRLFKKPEPYKGKGLRYLNENVVQKEGKKKKK